MSSGSSRADKAVEPTRSTNITVSCRRSASCRVLGPGGVGGASRPFSDPSDAIARSNFLRGPSGRPSFSRSASVKSGKDVGRHLGVAECPLVPLEPQAAQSQAEMSVAIVGRASSAQSSRTSAGESTREHCSTGESWSPWQSQLLKATYGDRGEVTVGGLRVAHDIALLWPRLLTVPLRQNPRKSASPAPFSPSAVHLGHSVHSCATNCY